MAKRSALKAEFTTDKSFIPLDEKDIAILKLLQNTDP